MKYALLSILIRIFSPYRGRIMFIYVLLGCLTIYYIIAEIVKIRMCDQRAALIADSVISVVTDIMILVLPLPLTWSLQMSRSKKLRVIGMLSAGGLATAFSVYRLILVLKDGSSPNATVMFMCVILSGYVSTILVFHPSEINILLVTRKEESASSAPVSRR